MTVLRAAFKIAPMPFSAACTTSDCHLDGVPIGLDQWSLLHSNELGRIVGIQQPGEEPEESARCEWQAIWVTISDLLHASEDGDIPDKGWSAAYARYLKSDQQAVSHNSPQYAGRDAWIRDVWLPDTRIYPLYAVNEWSSDTNSFRLRLLDGYHRTAGAFHYGAKKVFALIGHPVEIGVRTVAKR